MAQNDPVSGLRVAKSYFTTAHPHPQMQSRYGGMWGAPGIPSQWARDRNGQVQDFLTREAAMAAAAVCLCAALNRARFGAKEVVVRSAAKKEAHQTASQVFANFK